MERPRSRVRIVVALLVAVMAALCAWLVTSIDDHDEAEGTGGTTPAAAGTPNATSAEARRAPRASEAASSGEAVVEIDDAPIPEGATGTIRGIVRDDLGRPVAGAWVGAHWHHVARDEGPQYPPTKSAEDGSYAIEDLDVSLVWVLGAYSEGHAGATPSRPIVFSARRLEVTRDVLLPRKGFIDVVALDAGGAALGHEVRVLSLDGEDEQALDADGLAPGRYRILVEAPPRAGDSRVVDVTAGETTRVEFRLGDEAEIAGVVVDSDGTPVRKIEVVAIVADPALAPLDGKAVTAADGSFRIGGLRPTRYRLAVMDPWFSADATEPLLAPATGATLRLRDEAKVTFRLVYPPGFSAVDRSAEVGVEVTAHGAYRRPSPRWDRDQGTIRIPGDQEVELVIFVVHCSPWYRRVRARSGEVLDIGEVRPDLLRDVGGTVLDAAGRPISGATVRRGEGRFRHFSATDEHGEFRLESMPQADCVLQIEAPGFVAARVDCRADDTSRLAVKLVRAGRLWVRAEAFGGAPLAAATVHVDDTSGNAWWDAPTALDGSGECVARLAPGRWRITVTGCAPVDVDVREGATTSVRLTAAR